MVCVCVWGGLLKEMDDKRMRKGRLMRKKWGGALLRDIKDREG